MMEISDLKEKFTQELKETYTPAEIDSAFLVLDKHFRKEVCANTSLRKTYREELENAWMRLKKNEPLEYIIGEAIFFGRSFKVNSHVHVPRPESETMVQWVLEDFRTIMGPLDLLDIGTGSGVLPITLKMELPEVMVTAMDISEDALQVAGENAKRHNAKIELLNADLFQLDKLPRQFDIIVSNPPYILKHAQKDVQRKFLAHEPPVALYIEDSDPMVFNRKIAQLANNGLKEKGAVYVEINQFLESETSEVFQELGFKTACRKDVFGNPRTLKAYKE